MPNVLSLAVKGALHPNRKTRGRGKVNRLFEIELCQPGEPVYLELEPDNPVDPLAVMINSALGIQIGYVSAERCGFIGSRIRAGTDVRAIFQQATPWGAYIRVTLDGSEPTLPEPKMRTDQDDYSDTGFWPDPIWPDD